MEQNVAQKLPTVEILLGGDYLVGINVNIALGGKYNSVVLFLVQTRK